MSTVPETIIDQLRRVNLQTHLEKDGYQFRGGKAICKFHADTDPSLAVQQQDSGEWIWSCFGGCHVTGADIITYERKKNGALSFVDTVKQLCAEYHIPFGSNGNTPIPPAADLSAAPTEPTPSAKPITAAEYAEAHGVPWWYLEKQGWQEIVAKSGAKAIRIPSTDGNPRIRLLSEKRFWREREGQGGICWYAFPGTRDDEKVASLVVLCNGQISVESARFTGIQAFCFTDGEKAIPAHLLPDLKQLLDNHPTTTFIIALDNDKQGQHATGQIVEQLSEYRQRILVADFIGKKEHYDLADFIVEHKNAAKAEFPRHCKPYTPPPAQLEAAKKITAIVDGGIQIVSGHDVLQQTEERRQRQIAKPTAPDVLFSRIGELDYALQGFVHNGVYLFAADTGLGKSTLAVSIVCRLLEQAPGFIICGELSKEVFVNRMKAYFTGIPNRHGGVPYGLIERNGSFEKQQITHGEYTMTDTQFRPLSQAQHDQITIAARDIAARKPFFFHQGLNTPDKILENVTNAIALHGVKWVLIDSMNEASINATASIYENTRAVALMAETIAREHGVTIIATCQTGRHTDLGKPPRLHDTYGGTFLESKAHAMLGIYDPNYKEPDELLDDQLPPPERPLRIVSNKIRDVGSGRGFPVWVRFGMGFYNPLTKKTSMRS